MKIRQKLILGFLAVSLLVGLVGAIGLYANRQVVLSFESGEEHFGSIIEASNEVSSYAKRAEGHAMLFLTLHNEADREKFFKRIESLQEQTSIIDKSAENPGARKILENITSKTRELELIGQTLFKAYEDESKSGNSFNFKVHENEIRKLDDTAAGIRSDGLALAKLELQLEEKQKESAKEGAALLYNISLAISAAAVIFALFLGYTVAGKISGSLARLTGVAADVGKGRFGARMEVGSKDEIGELAIAFNKMAEDLQNSSSEIEKREKALKQSKKELEEKVYELGTFSKIAVGRELKMADLKKKMNALQSEKSKAKKGVK